MIEEAIIELEGAFTHDLHRLISNPNHYFSHRHAEALHVFGIQIELENPQTEYNTLLLRVSLHSWEELGDYAQAEVIWFRSKKDFGITDFSVRTKGLTRHEIDEFRKTWPVVLKEFESALIRGKPNKHAA